VVTGTLRTPAVASNQPSQGASRWDAFTVALAFLMLTNVWRLQDLFPILATLQVPTLAAVASYGLFLIDRDPRRRLRRANHKIVKIATVLFGLALVCIPAGVYPGLSFRFLTLDFSKTFVMMILLAAGMRDRRDIQRMMLVNLIGAVLYSFMVITRIPVGSDGRLGDLYYYDANDLGMLLIMTIPLVVYFARAGMRPLIRAGAVFSLLVLMVALVKTGSRGGFLGFVAVGGFMVWRYRAISKKLRLSAVAVMAVLLLAFGSDRYWTMMSTMLHPSQDYNFSGNAESGRMEIWKRGMGYMMGHPFTGVGANAFPAAEGMISPLAARQQLGIGLKWSAAHNSFVQIGAETGVIGLALFIAMLYQAARALARRRSNGSGGTEAGDAMAQTFAATLVGYCVAGFFLSQGYSAYLYAILGLVAGLDRPDGGMAPSGGGTAPVGPRDRWRASVPRFGTAR
jgi:O-Antigen ligase